MKPLEFSYGVGGDMILYYDKFRAVLEEISPLTLSSGRRHFMMNIKLEKPITISPEAFEKMQDKAGYIEFMVRTAIREALE